MNDKMINRFSTLFNKAKSIPRKKNDPTFMEICQLWGDRFEERCSQIFKFYFQPKEPHNLKELFLVSLLDILNDDISFINPREIRVLSEEGTQEGKKIDLTIIGEDFVIAIENKITASFYNPVDSYVKHITEHYGEKPHKFFVLLSVKRITDISEIKKIREFGYQYINYLDFFDNLKSRIGFYLQEANPVYVTFLNDFIKTIEKRYYNSYNMELQKFFIENQKSIDELIWQYEQFKKEKYNQRKGRIADIRYLISERTGRKWWVWQGWDLGTEFYPEGNKIGIECSFHGSRVGDIVGDFHIYITVWKKKHFLPYEEALKKEFPNNKIDYNPKDNPDRVYMHFPKIDGNNTEEIVSTLAGVYDKLKAIVEKINK